MSSRRDLHILAYAGPLPGPQRLQRAWLPLPSYTQEMPRILAFPPKMCPSTDRAENRYSDKNEHRAHMFVRTYSQELKSG